MKQLQLIQAAFKSALIPGGGLFLAIFLPLTGNLEPWMLPLIAGMLGTPLVTKGANGRKDS
jgi:hypothetical protein